MAQLKVSYYWLVEFSSVIHSILGGWIRFPEL
jgi:hypothetical protein